MSVPNFYCLVYHKCAWVVVACLLLFTLQNNCVMSQQLICENRNPEGHTLRKSEGDGGFRVVVVGNYSTRGHYAPNDVYTVTIQGQKTSYSIQKFTEFLLVAESEKHMTMGQSNVMTTGVFHIVDDFHSRFSEICPEGVTNVNMQPKSEISVLWTAPSVLVASCITFKATVVERPHVWYMDDGELTKTLCPEMPRRMRNSRPSIYNRLPAQEEQSEGTRHVQGHQRTQLGKQGMMNKIPENGMVLKEIQVDSSGILSTVASNVTETSQPQLTVSTPVITPQCCACDEAKYEVRFEGIWSKETHPKDFPENEWLLHFSDIIGASHSSNFSVWKPGEVASEGIRQVAEWGATRHLENELKSKSRFINTIIKAKGLWHPDERGTTSAAFRVDKHHHLMSLVSMIGPSPDWIVGITSFNLCLTNCTWMEEADFDLYPFDAGTDSGITYMSPNSPTEPRQNIRPLTSTDPDDPRSPFYDLSNTEPMKPFAKVHIRRQRIYAKDCNDTSKSVDDAAHEIYLTENSEDISRPECAVSDWTPWSDCSVTCGKGLRMRKRSYMIPMKADMFRCDRQLVEKEMCLGLEPSCNFDNTSVFEEVDSVCAVTPWSGWTPCSVTCGKGTRSRSRRYKNHMGRKKCTLEMTQTEMCVISMECDKNNTVSEDCPMTPWSQWTPCSVTCGIGIRERTRFPLLTDENEIKEKCGSISTAQQAPCTGEFGISCQISMGEAKEICTLPSDVGPCRTSQTKFFYSVEKAMCVPFEWGGCKGNRNRFETESECSNVCGFLRTMLPPTQETLPETQTDAQLRQDIAATTTTVSPTPELLPTEYEITATTTEPFELRAHHAEKVDGDGEDDHISVDTVADDHTGAVNDPSNVQQKSGEISGSAEVEVEESEPTSIDCVVSRWSSWSPCSVTCGTGGIKTRSREILIRPLNGGKKCPRLYKKRSCKMDPC